VVTLPDGGYLIAEGGDFVGRVRRVSPKGIITTIAGGGGSLREGASALDARLDGVTALAFAADGSILIGGTARVRRVDPKGVIRTVAGTGEYGFSGDGGAATQAMIRNPQSLASLRDGSFLMADTYNLRVRRVDAHGTIATVAGKAPGATGGGPATAANTELGWVTAVTALDDDSYLLATSGNSVIYRVDATGALTTVLERSVFDDFSGRELVPALALSGSFGPTAMAMTPDGGLVFNSHSEIVYAAPAQPARTGVRIRGARVVGARGSLVLATTQSGEATVRIGHGRRGVTTPASPVPGGRSSLRVRLPRRPGPYQVRVVLRQNGRIAADQLTLFVGRRLPLRLARESYDSTVTHDDDVAWGIRCHRRSARRIDCEIRSGDPGRRLRCAWRAAIEAGRDGILRSREYRCPPRGRPPASPLRHANILPL
jgi:hypothetical protein